MPESTIPNITVHDSVEIPQLGFGVFQVPPEKTQSAVELALEAGYRHIDTAAAYHNEKGVGAALAASGLPREDYFVTTKLLSSQQGHDSTLAAFEASLDRLGLDHVDLFLIHWPVPTEGLFLDTWRAFERIHGEEAARTIGVSNFRIEDLELLEREMETLPAVNQVELHPRLQQADLRAWHAEHGIVTEARSPLAQGELLADETIGEIAARHGKSPAQAILRWHVQLGNIAISKAGPAERIRENIEIFDFELSDEEMAAIGGSSRRPAAVSVNGNQHRKMARPA
ncbi:MAG TPA: aldo/keto reductase [Solirubrobacterales bacterium]|nr:aldo/keto reductase [Solirubrobacterales bacterium]